MADKMPNRTDIWVDVLEELVYAAAWKDAPASALLTGHLHERGEDDVGADVTTTVTGFTKLGYGDTLDGALAAIGRHVELAWDDGSPPVGLFVSQRGGEGRPPDEAMRAHLSYFNRTGQGLWVIDPERRRLGVFERPRGGSFRPATWNLRHRDTDSNNELIDEDGDDDGHGDERSDPEREHRRDRGERDPRQPGKSDG